MSQPVYLWRRKAGAGWIPAELPPDGAGAVDFQNVVVPAVAVADLHALWHVVEAVTGSEEEEHGMLRLSLRVALYARSRNSLLRAAVQNDLQVSNMVGDTSRKFVVGYLEHRTFAGDDYPPDSAMARSLAGAQLLGAAVLLRSASDGDNLPMLDKLRQQPGLAASALRVYWS